MSSSTRFLQNFFIMSAFQFRLHFSVSLNVSLISLRNSFMQFLGEHMHSSAQARITLTSPWSDVSHS